MRFGILGRGFGLYGYVPALMNREETQVSTLMEYRDVILRRPDLAMHSDKIEYRHSLDDLLASCGGLVVAKRPLDQEVIVRQIINSGWSGSLVLEKPLAANPDAAIRVNRMLRESGISYRIAFTFTLTEWFNELLHVVKSQDDGEVVISVKWRFNAHHYLTQKETWKRYQTEGGGALRFYTIHIVAALALLGHWAVIKCDRTTTQTDEEPACSFSATHGSCRAMVSCSSNWRGEARFEVNATRDGRQLVNVNLADPFQEAPGNALGATPHNLDYRTKYTKRLLDTFADDSASYLRWYNDHLRLWRELEGAAEVRTPESIILE